MFRKIIPNFFIFLKALSQTSTQLKNQYAFELMRVKTCSKTAKHLIEVKVVGKGQSISCAAQDIVDDNDFIVGFSPSDIRTIACIAITDKYEAILYQEKIKKSHEVIRSKDRDGKKTFIVRNKLTGDSMVKSVSDFSDGDLIDSLESKDAYHLGYLAGQDQVFRNFAQLKILSSKNDESNFQTET